MNKYSMFCVAVFELLSRKCNDSKYKDLFEFNYNSSMLRIKYVTVIIDIVHYNDERLICEVYNSNDSIVYDDVESVKNEIIELVNAFNQKQ